MRHHNAVEREWNSGRKGAGKGRTEIKVTLQVSTVYQAREALPLPAGALTSIVRGASPTHRDERNETPHGVASGNSKNPPVIIKSESAAHDFW